MSNDQKMRSYEQWHASLQNFEWLSEVVPGAMDVDVFIERRGHFLVIEAKPWQNGVNVGFGQHLALEALSKLDEFDVFLVGEVEGKDSLKVIRYDAGEPIKKGTRPVWFPPRRFLSTNKAGLAQIVKGWYDEASKR